MSNASAGYECCCGFKCTRATNFLRHIKEAAAPGQVHRLIEADAERLAQADNQLWQISPDRSSEEQQPRAEGPRKGSSRASRPAVLNDKERSAPTCGTNSHIPSSGGEAQANARRKRSDSITHSEGATTTKRQATADAQVPAPDFNLTSQTAHGPYPSRPNAAQTVQYTGAYNTRSRSQQSRPLHGDALEDLAAAPMYPLHDAELEVEHTVQYRSHTTSAGVTTHEHHARSVHVLKSSADGAILGGGHCAQEPDASELPVSVTACFDDSLQAAIAARQGKDALKVCRSGNPLFAPHGNENRTCEEPFLPDCWDADGLAEWFVYLISWQNRKNSLQGLVGGLYILAFAHELWERVTWPPVSVISLLALFAVCHSAMPAGMPALSKLLRKAGVTDQSGTVVRSSQVFQELTVTANKKKGVAGVWGDCKDVVADISCTALQAISDVAQMWEPPAPTQRRPGSVRGHSSQALLAGTSSGRFQAVPTEAPVGLSLNEVVKAGLILLQRASCYRSTAHTVAKLCLLWCLLFLSESAVLSQWNCAMAAYVSCFGWRACWERYGDLLEELLRAVGGVLPLLCSHHYRANITFAAGSAIVVMWMLGTIALVPRITVSALAGLVCLLWQLQRRHHSVKQHKA